LVNLFRTSIYYSELCKPFSKTIQGIDNSWVRVRVRVRVRLRLRVDGVEEKPQSFSCQFSGGVPCNSIIK